MLEALFMTGQLAVAAVGGLMAAGIWITLGGLGAMSRLNKRADVLEDELTRIDSRLSRDQKTRAAATALEARVEERTIKQQALDHLSHGNGRAAPVRMPGRTQTRK